MKQWLQKVFYRFLVYSGIVRLFMLFNKSPIVVTYHNVLPDDMVDSYPGISPDMKASVFEEQLQIIQDRYPITSELEPGKVTVTFDDGYRNNAAVAAPILADKRIPATFFVPAVMFEASKTLWVDKIMMWLSWVPDGNYTISGINVTLNDHADRLAAFERIWDYLFDRQSQRTDFLDHMERAHSFSDLSLPLDYASLRYEAMSKSECREMAENGHKVACHSYSHPVLSQLTDSDLEDEFNLCESQRELYNSDWFSYPFGRANEVDDRAVNACKDRGFSCAFMNIDAETQDLFRIRRFNMPMTTDRAHIYVRLSGCEAFVRRLSRSIRGVLRLGA